MRERAANILTTGRLLALSDGVYAIAMTLLVLSIDIPDLPRDATASDLSAALIDLLPKFYAFVLSFLLLGAFWMVHHRQFHRIRYVTGPLLWINILALLFVALLPLSTDLVGEYGHQTLASVVFDVNLLCIGVLHLAQWWYAAQVAGVVEPPMSKATLRASLLLNLVIPLVSLIAIGLAFVSPRHSNWVYLATLPLVSIARVHANRVETSEASEAEQTAAGVAEKASADGSARHAGDRRRR